MDNIEVSQAVRILVAEDDPISRELLRVNLQKWNYSAVVTEDGTHAWEVITGPNPPRVVILDWMMPGIDGLELTKRIRASEKSSLVYVILLTAKGHPADIVTGLNAGANDYLTKPFHHEELQARVAVGVRMTNLRAALQEKVVELEKALSEVKELHGLLPICSYCKKIRNDDNYWEVLERYISDHSHAEFSHGICPDCYEKHIIPQLKQRSPE